MNPSVGSFCFISFHQVFLFSKHNQKYTLQGSRFSVIHASDNITQKWQKHPPKKEKEIRAGARCWLGADSPIQVD